MKRKREVLKSKKENKKGEVRGRQRWDEAANMEWRTERKKRRETERLR